MHRMSPISICRPVLLCCSIVFAGNSGSADLTEFCLAERPKDDGMLAAQWDLACPSIFRQLAASAQENAELDLQKKELENAKLTADLIAPLPPTTDKTDVTAFAIEAEQHDAALTFAVARKIGEDLKTKPMCPVSDQVNPPGPRVAGGPVTFRWDPVPDAKSYVFSLWDRSNGESVPATTESGMTEARATLSADSKFAWTVTSCSPDHCILATPIMYVHTDANSAPQSGLTQVQSSSNCATAPLLLVTGTERSSLIGSISSDVLIEEVKNHTDAISKLRCSPSVDKEGKDKFEGMSLDAVAIAAGLKLFASAASYFQPQILASAAVAKITEPQQLIAAGVASGLGQGRWDLRLHEPTIAADNPVLKAVKLLRDELIKKTEELDKCVPADKVAQEGKAILKKTDEYLASILRAEAGARSAVGVAARDAALRKERIRHTLLISRDVGGGTAALVKPYGLSSIRILSAAGVVLSYQLVNLDTGVPVAAGCRSARRSATTKASKWPDYGAPWEEFKTDCNQ